MSTAVVDQFDELPRVPGPKLGRFLRGNYKKIEYIKLLGVPNEEEQLPVGDHGYVFEVRIDGEPYALKIFRFFDVEDSLALLDPRGRSVVSREEAEGQTDPFYAECRAYGRIASKPRKRPIAIACHGFVSIPADEEEFFAEQFMVTEWDRPQDEMVLPVAEQQPFRALVKDLVETDPEVTIKLAQSMWRELRALNSLKIYVMDVQWNNYKGGHLVDFSAAWTEPHLEFRRDVNPKVIMDINRGIDTAAFRVMVEVELGMDLTTVIKPPAEPNSDFLNRLRPRRKRT